MVEGKIREKLPLGTKLIYGVGRVGFTGLISSVGFFLMIFYTDVAMIPPAIASIALLISKVWDVVNDVLFGWLSDKTESKHGRRRVYLIYGAIPLAVFTFLLWSTPKGLDPLVAFFYIVLTYALFDTFLTLTRVPYSALAPELTPDYDERTSLMAVASIGAVIGYMAGAVLMPMITQSFADLSTGYKIAGGVFGAIAGVCVIIVAWRIKEPKKTYKKKPDREIIPSIKAVLKNRPFLMLISAFGLVRLAFTFMQTSIPYFIKYQIGESGKIAPFLAVLMITVAVFIYFWKWISDKTSKNLAYAGGLAVLALAAVSSFFLGQGEVMGMYLFMVFAGFGLSAHWVAPYAMIPDVVEDDELRTGERREGMYYGIYGLVDKLMRTLGVFFVGIGLDLFNYVPNVEQTAHSLFGIRLLFGPIPAVILLIALPVLIWYPINRIRHSKMREKISKNKEEAQEDQVRKEVLSQKD